MLKCLSMKYSLHPFFKKDFFKKKFSKFSLIIRVVKNYDVEKETSTHIFIRMYVDIKFNSKLLFLGNNKISLQMKFINVITSCINESETKNPNFCRNVLKLIVTCVHYKIV